MRPVNLKSMQHSLWDKWEMLEKKEIDPKTCQTFVNLTNASLGIEKVIHQRAKIEMQIEVHNSTHSSNIKLMDIGHKTV